MDQDFDLDMDEFRKEIGEDLPRSRENRSSLRSRWPADFKPQKGSLFLGLIGALILIVVLFFLFGRGKKTNSDDLSMIKGKFAEIENRLARLESTDKRIASLETKVKKLEASMSKMTGSQALRTKKRRYHEVGKGENLSVIAQKYGITVDELCRLNKITPKTVIQPGQKLLVSK
jgi:LysM repeat protein